MLNKKIENLIYKINNLIEVSETMPDDSGNYNLTIFVSDDTLTPNQQKEVINGAIAYFDSIHIYYPNHKYYISIYNENDKDYCLHFEW